VKQPLLQEQWGHCAAGFMTVMGAARQPAAWMPTKRSMRKSTNNRVLMAQNSVDDARSKNRFSRTCCCPCLDWDQAATRTYISKGSALVSSRSKLCRCFGCLALLSQWRMHCVRHD
jgi:hypothetical protein